MYNKLQSQPSVWRELMGFRRNPPYPPTVTSLVLHKLLSQGRPEKEEREEEKSKGHFSMWEDLADRDSRVCIPGGHLPRRRSICQDMRDCSVRSWARNIGLCIRVGLVGLESGRDQTRCSACTPKPLLMIITRLLLIITMIIAIASMNNSYY